MCAVSMIADDWTKRRSNDYIPAVIWPGLGNPPGNPPTRTEFEALKKELEELKTELEKAKLIDIENGEPDCEMEEKVAIFRRLGELFGVDFNEVLKPNAS